MFDKVREKKRLVQIVLALIIIPFALWGVSSYDQSGNSAQVIATVDGTKITRQEFDNAQQLQQQRMREQLGANFDAAMLENPGMKRAIIDNLVKQRLLVERAKDARLVVTDDQMAQVIGAVEAFRTDGKFDKKQYQAVLSSNNLTPLRYEARLRDEILGQDMQGSYTQNGYSPESVAENIFRLTEQQRMIRVAPVSFQRFMAQANVEDSAVRNYYDLNQHEYRVPEQAKVEFVKFAMDNLVTKAEVAADEARKYYDGHQNEFGAPEQRQAAHILINAAPTAPQAERDAAKVQAERLQQQARQNPATFAELAKQNSQDPGSATQGGDLGFFGHGMMVKPFEDVAYGMKVGDISDVVQTDFGYHIIKLIAIKPAKISAFDAVRAGILSKLRQQKATDMFAELADKFSNTVYEQSDTLQPAATLIGAKIEQSAWLTKGMKNDAPWTAAMLQAIFTDEIVKNKRNTAATEVAPNTLVAARILDYKPATVRPLGEVQEAIRQKLLRQQALELAAKQGKALLEELHSGSKPALAWGAVQSVTRLKPGALDAGLARQVFQANTDSLPQYVGAEDAQQGYVLVRIDAVKESGEISDANRVRYIQQLRQLTGEEMFQAYLANAKQQASISVNLPDNALGNAPDKESVQP